MTNRTKQLLTLRPDIPAAKIENNMSAEEYFQNQTLRPIIKFQHDLIIDMFKNHIAKRKHVFYALSIQKQLDYINQAIQRDLKFRHAIKGVIIGHFTVEEYAVYIENSSALNKRILGIIKERLISSIQLLQAPN